MFGTILENVVLDRSHAQSEVRGSVDHREHARVVSRCTTSRNHVASGRGGHPKNIVFLTADAFGVLPPIARLTREQAMYYFLSGYTAKVAGTERGVKEPQATFSSCFGAVFLVWHPSKYAEMLGQLHRRARVRRLARQHRLDRRRVRRRQAHEALAHARDGRARCSRGDLHSAPVDTDPIFG